jgi:hypothetical protein
VRHYYSHRFLVMSEDFGRLNRLVQEASGILTAANGKVKIVQAMQLVGFTTPERKNMKVYQQVRRLAAKLIVFNPTVKTSLAIATPLDSSHASTISSITAERSIIRIAETPSSQSTTSYTSSRSEDESIIKRRLIEIPDDEDGKPAAKVARRTSKEVQRANAAYVGLTQRDKLAMKQATILIDRNKALASDHPDKQSITSIVDLTNSRLSSNISASTAARYVRDGMVGVSPMKKGPVGNLQPRVYDALKGAFVTYLKLEQAGCKKQSTVKELSKLVNACVNRSGFNLSRDDLTRKLKRDTADHFVVGKANVVEQRRLMWTTSYNLEIWFKTWKDTLIDLGFGRAKLEHEEDDYEGEVVFFPGQRDRIGNVDETDGSLDDTTGQRGGRPAMTFFAPDVPGGGTAVNKSGYSATVICGSTAAGDPFPAHFQLKTLAQTPEGQRMSVDWFRNTKKVIGKFGFPSRRPLPCTFGMNERAGMNAVELNKYMKNSILPLYPDIEDREF